MGNQSKEDKKVQHMVNRIKKRIEKGRYNYHRHDSFIVPDYIKNNKEAMLELVDFITDKYFFYDSEKSGKVECLAKQIGEDLLRDPDFMIKACSHRFSIYSSEYSLLHYIELKSKEIAMALVRNNPENLKDMPKYNDDEEVVISAVRRSGTTIQYASDRLRGDYDLGRIAVTNSAEAFEYLSDKLRDNKDLALIAVRDPEANAVVHASDRLKDDTDVAREAVKANGEALEQVSIDRRSEHEIVSYAIKHSPAFIKSASNRYLYSEPLLFKAVRQSSAVLQYVPEEMRKVMVEMLDNYESANSDESDSDKYL